MLVTSERPDGSSARIVYRNGAVVNAEELERLCEKVMQNSSSSGSDSGGIGVAAASQRQQPQHLAPGCAGRAAALIGSTSGSSHVMSSSTL